MFGGRLVCHSHGPHEARLFSREPEASASLMTQCSKASPAVRR
jgi:hypothetical protein